MKVKILATNNPSDLEKQINSFISDKTIFNIDYSIAAANDGRSLNVKYSVLIQYING